MKINKNLLLRKVAGEYMIVNLNLDSEVKTNVYSLNESAAYLWEKLKDKNSFTIPDMLEILSAEYEIPCQDTALDDLHELLKDWLKIGIVIEE